MQANKMEEKRETSLSIAPRFQLVKRDCVLVCGQRTALGKGRGDGVGMVSSNPIKTLFQARTHMHTYTYT